MSRESAIRILLAALAVVSVPFASLAEPSRARTLDVSTVAALRALSVVHDGTASLEGYSARGDGGGGALHYDAGDRTTADNGCTVFVDAAGHRWKRTLIGDYFPEWCGAKGGASDDTAALQAVLITIQTAGKPARLVLRQFYRTQAPLTFAGARLSIVGESLGAGLTLDHTGDGIDLGVPQPGARSTELSLADLTIQQNAKGTAGAALRVLNTQGLNIDSVYTVGVRNGIVLGAQ